MIRRRDFIAGGLAAGAAFAGALVTAPRNLRAATPKPAALGPDELADLDRIETYLDSITTMAATFQQVDQEGRVATGRIFLARPGRMRVEYDPPSPILLVATSGALVYYDSELDQVTTLPLSSTPAWFLVQKDIRLTNGVTVTRFERGPGSLRVELVETSDAGAGSVLITFSDRPLALKQWRVTDAQGIETQVALLDASFGVEMNPALFAVPQPRRKHKQSN